MAPKFDFDVIRDKIQDEFDYAEYTGDADIEERLSTIVGYPARHCDTKIDDGVDDEDCEDEYVMKSSFIFSDINLSVDMYYGDVTSEITYIEIK